MDGLGTGLVDLERQTKRFERNTVLGTACKKTNHFQLRCGKLDYYKHVANLLCPKP